MIARAVSFTICYGISLDGSSHVPAIEAIKLVRGFPARKLVDEQESLSLLVKRANK